ncbi:T9SS type A sorting domain-containing protein [Flavobacterium solisilvae]|uniref:T9SS type A sorting domain-containing protein n=1 Tax=Flavobacterium solisilvae TaxID=1852019 RepID=A0ABX1QWK7_9FLAO|nr:T9SS type A sorting domain-containing protein [Flavobacterium solisilvae]NMH25493.1 T9SS type A sorting domain-containing protein [Flavobacterium solisilvae]
MKFIKITFFLLFIWSKELPAQNLDVQRLWGSYYAPETSRMYGLKEDKFGNLFGFAVIHYPYNHDIVDYMNSFITEDAFDSFHEENSAFTSFVFKLSPQGNVLWSTFFPGVVMDIAFPPNGLGFYLCGDSAHNSNLIASENALFPNQDEFGTDVFSKMTGFIIKFDVNGQKLWGTYLPNATYLETDSSGNVYVTGTTHLTELFGGEDAFDSNFIYQYTGNNFQPNAYILKLNPEGELQWSTYYGVTQISSITTKNNEFYVTGRATNSNNYYATEVAFLSGFNSGMYLSKFNTAGERLWSTYYGSGVSTENIWSVKVTTNNKVLISGFTSSNINIATSGTFRENKLGTNDYFIAQFDTEGNREWGTYFGGEGYDTGIGILDVLDINDNYIFTCGSTKSSNGIATPDGLNNTISNTSFDDAFINIFDHNGNRLWGSYYGGVDYELEVGILTSIYENSFYLYGGTRSISGISTLNGAYPNFNYFIPPYGSTHDNAYLAKFSIGTLNNPAHNTNEISLYPNPNNGSFTLSGSVLGKENFEMQLYNMQGQQLVNRNLSLYEEQNFNFSPYLKSGIYILKLQSKEQKIQKEFKFIVK